MILRGIGCCVLLILLNFPLLSQCDDTISESCIDSRIICDVSQILNLPIRMNDTSCYQQDTFISCVGIWDIQFDNPAWFSFLATDPMITMELTIDNCASGSRGIQYALIENCSFTDTLKCAASNGGGAIGFDGTIIIQENVNVGSVYSLLVDGWGGSVCDITFTDLDGFGTVVLEPINDLSIPQFSIDTICNGALDVLFDLDAGGVMRQFTKYYQWTLSHEGNGILDSITIDSSLVLDLIGMDGNYELCVFGYNECDSTNQVCKNFVLEAIPDEVLDTLSFCMNELPIMPTDPRFLGTTPIITLTPNPAVYTIVNSEGCSYEQRIPLDPKSDSKRYFLDTAVCDGIPLNILNMEFASNVTDFDIVMPGMTQNGCDSLATVNIAFLEFDGMITTNNCSGSEVELNFVETLPIFENADSTSIVWTNSSNETMLDTSNNGFTLVVSESGDYEVEIMVEKYGVRCVKKFTNYAEPEMPTINAFCDSTGLDMVRINWNSISLADDYTILIDGSTNIITTDTSLTLNGINPDQSVEFEITANHPGTCPSPNFILNCQTSSCPANNDLLLPQCDSIGLDMIRIKWNGVPLASQYSILIDGSTNIMTTDTILELNGLNPDQNIEFEISPIHTGICPIPPAVINCQTDSCPTNDDLLLPQCDSTGLNTVRIKWSSIPLASQYSILIDGSTNIMTTDTILELNGLNPDQNVEFEISPIHTGLCPIPSAIINCQTTSCPSIDIDLFPIDTIYCVEPDMSEIQLNVQFSNSPAPGTGTWSGTSVNAVTGLFDPNNAGAGIHTIRYTYAGSGCAYSDSLEIEARPTPSIMLSSDEIICVDDTLDLNLSGTFDAGASFTWQADGSTVLGISPGPFKIKWPNPGDYEVKIELDQNGCKSNRDSVLVTVEPLLQPPIISCQGSTSSITFSWNTVDCASNYQVLIDGINQGIFPDTFFVIQDLIPEEEKTIEVIAISDCECPNVRVMQNCFAKACPNITVTTGDLDNICNNDLDGNILLPVDVSGSDGSGKGYWTGPGIIDSSGVIDPKLAGIGDHTYLYSFAEEGCPFAGQTEFSIFDNPQAEIILDNPLCPDETSGTVIIEPSGGTPDYIFELNNTSQTTPMFSGIPIGDHELLVEDMNGCLFKSNLEITAPFIPVIDLTGPEIINEGNMATLALETNIPDNLIDSVTWSKNGFNFSCSELNCNRQLSDELISEATYCVNVYYSGECVVSDCYTVKVRKSLKIYVPNVFSPNGDAINSSFNIFSNDQLSRVIQMKIYDRWGELMYEESNFIPSEDAQGWDGTFNGDLVQPGVYIYMIEIEDINGEIKRLSGDLTVIR